MSLITAKIGITPQTLHTYLDAVDRLGCTYQLIDCSPSTRAGSMVFELFIDGSDSTFEVTLRPDGAWSATTHVVVGEAP